MPFVRNYRRYRTDTVLHRSLDDFCHAALTPGIQVIGYEDALLELMVVDRQAATTIVVFHAAADPATTSLPLFVGQQLTENLDANLIFVSDPMLGRSTAIGWFTGSPSLPLQDDLVRAISHIQDGLGNAENLIFYGSSAGAFAALYYSHRFPGSLAIVANPQTTIAGYYPGHVKAFLDSSWAGAPIEDIPAVTDITPLYAESFPNHVAYLQCSDDELHLTQHCRPWKDATADHAARRRFLVGDWGPGHAPPPFYLLQGILEFAVSLGGHWDVLLADDMFSDNITG